MLYSRYVLFFIPFITAFGCNHFESKKEALVNHYTETLAQDYEAYRTSGEYAQFKIRYAEMLKISKEMADNPPKAFANNIEKQRIICMGLPEEVENEMNWETWQTQQKKVVYKDFVNFSKQVTAVMVSGTFYKKNAVSDVGLEAEMHAVYMDMNNPDYLRQSETYPAYSFKEFCLRRIVIDKVNNSKFLLILNPTKLEIDQYLSKKTVLKGEFKDALYEAMLYVYSFEKHNVVQAIEINAQSSDEIDPGYHALDEAVRKDLEQNVQRTIRHELDSLYTYKGTDPALKIH